MYDLPTEHTIQFGKLPVDVEGMELLQVLDLQHASIEEPLIPPHLSGLVHLQVLKLNGGFNTIPPDLATLTELRELQLTWM